MRPELARSRAAAIARVPLGHVEAGVLQPVRHLAADRHLHAEQVVARGGEIGDLVERLVEIGLRDRRAEPRSAGLAEQVQELAASDAVAVHALDRGAGQAGRLGLGDRAAIGFAQQLGLEGEVDGARTRRPWPAAAAPGRTRAAPSRRAGRRRRRDRRGRSRASGRPPHPPAAGPSGPGRSPRTGAAAHAPAPGSSRHGRGRPRRRPASRRARPVGRSRRWPRSWDSCRQG